MQKIIQRWLVGIALACVFGSAIAFDSFVIRDIRVDGVRRLELGTVLTYLPFSIGDELDARSSRQGIKSLYETGLFQDIAFERDGDVLVIKVKERPAIASFEIEGNKKLGGDEIKEGLAQAGLAEGELYRRDLLDGVEQELRRQYYANGYYSVRIDTQVTEKGDNSVDIKIDVSEGPVAKINSINIVGNEVFEEDELVDDFELRPSRFISLFQSSNKYSKEKLLGDLERLTSYYQDRGYLRFEVSSVQVALSTNRRDISITINTNEGEIYTVEDTQLAGELVVKKEYLKRLVLLRPGDTFSRKLTTETGNLISRRLADEGYAFAKVDPLPRVDDEAKTVHLTFNVDSGKRVYVRQIGFTGNTATNDETLRREMRQLEGSSFSRAAVERSRERLQRLPFLQEVEVETEPVPGTDDLVDVDYKVSERPAGSVQVGVGFSDASGFLINGSLSHTNFRGTGDRINLQAERNEFAEYFNVSWTDPYATDDGISRTISGFFRNSE